ncbi:unnamed protein product [Paramecium octaurelia]|uniref:WD40-repeat-containing domain n=1 Tax=Paramecium octaurelia TaxID=43137 RepID=A0A8S1T3B8_PAROT|nr:unnamed protein product [Paramecium octaurelia]CAD8145202.1 unnamed protein product [Paramecium octaurelia]
MNNQKQSMLQNDKCLKGFDQNIKSYNLHNQYPVHKNLWCKTFAFIKDDSILVIGFNNMIKEYQIKNGNMKQFQVLLGHRFDVNCLKWANFQNQLISGGHDGKIFCWPKNLSSNSKFIAKCNFHSLSITHFLMNSKEDLLITASMDQTIKFSEKNKQNQIWECSQVITEYRDTIFSLSLSQNENKLISCGYDNLILVLQKDQQFNRNNWIVKQRIILDLHGYRLSFIKDDLFLFQPYNKEEIWIYEISNDLFIKAKTIHSKSDCLDFGTLFPHQYIQSKNIILAKNGNYIHLIKFDIQDNLEVFQSINFGDQCIYGQLSNDGQCLITWDNKSNLIQFRVCEKK